MIMKEIEAHSLALFSVPPDRCVQRGQGQASGRGGGGHEAAGGGQLPRHGQALPLPAGDGRTALY